MASIDKATDERIKKIELALNFVETAIDYTVSTNIVFTPVSAGFEIAETSLDGEVVTLGKSYLLYRQTNTLENGVYTVQSLNPVVLAKSLKFPNIASYNNVYFKKEGQNEYYYSTITVPITIEPTSVISNNYTSNYIYNFTAVDWVNGQIIIPYSLHNKTGTILFEVYEKINTSYALTCGVEVTFNNNFDITLKIGNNATPFDGYLSFAGANATVEVGIQNLQLLENGKIIFGNLASNGTGVFSYNNATQTFAMEHNDNGTLVENATFPPN
jgi:hypothetical protein